MSRPLQQSRFYDKRGTIALRGLADTEITRRAATPRTTSNRRIPRRLPPRVLGGLVRLMDLALVIAAAWAVFLLSAAIRDRSDTAGEFAVATLAAAYVTIAVLNRTGTYGLAALRRPRRYVVSMLAAMLAAAMAQYACRSILHESLAVPSPTLEFLVLATVLLLAARGILALCVARWIANGRLAYRIAVVGANDVAHQFLAQLATKPGSTTEVVGVYRDWPYDMREPVPGMEIAGNIDDLLAESRRIRLDGIAVALPVQDAIRATEIAARLGSAVADIYLVSDLPGTPLSPADTSPMDAPVALSIRRQPIKDWRAVEKAVFDYTFATIILLLFAPLMLGVAIAIRLESPGPVLFRQPRLGFNNQPFLVFKFRTMYHHLADLLADRQAKRDDPRVTRVGRWLRQFSIDELPQLFNVLRGDMSLVGPRPHAPNTRAGGLLFADAVATYSTRHRVKPGITGWAQVNGWRGETTTVQQIENRVAHDLYYIENWSLLFDIKILLLTLLREVVSRRAY